MNLLFLTFGRQSAVHLEAVFSILTFLRDEAPPRSVTVFTDAPEYYEALASRVEIVPTGEEVLKDWRGPHDFFWRVKIKALERLVRARPGQDVVYLDSDTFLYRPASSLWQRLAEGRGLMWESETVLAEGLSAHRALARGIEGRSFAGMRLDSLPMWNAGVVGIPARGAPAIVDRALSLCDALCNAKLPTRFVEQFALSVALQTLTDLRPARPTVAHYHSNKAEWREAIHLFLAERWIVGHDLPHALRALESFDFTRIPMLKRVRNTTRRVNRCLGKLLPDRNVYCHET